MQSLFLSTATASALLFAWCYSSFEPYDRSILSPIASIGLSTAILCMVQRYCPSLVNPPTNYRDRYDAILLNDHTSHGPFEQKKQSIKSSNRLSVGSHVLLLKLAVVAFTIRIELYRRISAVAQCTTHSWEVLVPFLLALNECRYQRVTQPRENGGPERNRVGHFFRRFTSRVVQSRWRYVPSAWIITMGCYLGNATWPARNSTYICPIASGHTTLIPGLQVVAMLLDCLIAVIVQEIIRSNNASRHKLLSVPLSCATIMLGTMSCWTIYSTILYFAKPEDIYWFTVEDTLLITKPLWLMLGRALLSSTCVISSLYCILHIGIYQLSIILVSCVTLFLSAISLWSARDPFPPATSNIGVWSFFMILFGVWSSYRIAQTVGQLQSSRLMLWPIVFCIVLFVLILPRAHIRASIDFHPIEFLMFDAKLQHKKYLSYASQSSNLQSAINTYQERYQRNPPPAFDKWYEYAQSRSVLIVDEYDQIHRDLLPFQSISPADLRRQTWEMVSNPWNEISGISIRNGKAQVQDNVLPTHRWMLEGIVVFINTFAQHLPDMDLAFNLNDESRVAVPFAKMDSLLNQAASSQPFNARSSWSSDRASTWASVAKTPYDKTFFENVSFQKNFQRFGSIGCHPSSLSRTHPYLSSQMDLCFKCFEPHSTGQFISNWTLAADMCHQPDISHLHGFYLSPAAFKTAHELVPVFSQSKAGGYNDILYPSSWNYMDKVKYEPTNVTGEYGTDTYSTGYPDPPFAEKENRLYWRGTTSEGVSAGVRTWLGMTRQRFVHLINNATSSSNRDQTTILLPNPNKPDEYVYHSLPGTALLSLNLQQLTNVKIVDRIARCGGVDCTDQAKEFGLVSPVDFQAHWRYKFLFDMDGAGFSGRFLPFLQSRSLPFKTALFREWYDSRITAWHHFVPIDLRLHGVWSTLAYFAGVDGVWPGRGNRRFKWEPHTAEAENIAEAGRAWANRVIRKADMEVYFFRLLLEWGRLTDDRRDELGFVLS